MKEEDKELLLKELCARLPYGVKVLDDMGRTYRLNIGNVYLIDLLYGNIEYVEAPFKPYLRPMSSMTDEEFEELKEYSGLKYDQLDLASYQNGTYKCLDFYLSEVPSYVVILVFEWLNKHHFDYRQLIEKGLAIEAPEGIYNLKVK